MNDFGYKVRPAFDFLVSDYGYHLTHEDVSSSFDNGQLIYESDHLRVQVVRDRGQVSFTVRAKGDYRDIDEEVLALLLAGALHYHRSGEPPDYTVASSAGFLRKNLAAIEQLFQSSKREETIHRAEAVKNERSVALFGARSDV